MGILCNASAHCERFVNSAGKGKASLTVAQCRFGMANLLEAFQPSTCNAEGGAIYAASLTMRAAA